MYRIITILLLLFSFVLPNQTFAAGQKNLIDTEVKRRLAMGETPNRLIGEKSPYLLQHAFNPVDWMGWGEEAFAQAAAEDKPIFLSIGYSTCHWCHVMAHESFEDPEVAALLNKWFVSIKVDREERPDIDQMYMAATQAISGSGGWPMSVFLMPDGSPFYAGTYFPPIASQNKPSFTELLTALHEAWLNNRTDIKNAATELITVLQKSNAAERTVLEANIAKKCLWLLAQDNDPTHGGFGTAPKFPRPSVFTFLFEYYQTTGDEKAKNMALHTLQKMAGGGIYDHLGGGFHRYSVDQKWFVPHFEKMLYDQSQLAVAYLNAYHLTGDNSYARVAQEIFDYLLRDMHDPGGGFYSAEDADSDDPYVPGDHGEGAYYLWTDADLVERLGRDDAALFSYRYGVLPDGNVDHDPLKEFTGKNILYHTHTIDETAAHFKTNPEHVEKRLAAAKTILFESRSKRTRPHLDDKIITSWNGLLIGALARGSVILNDPALLKQAAKTATFVRSHLYDEQTGSLMRRFRANEAGLPGQLDDYATLVAGLIELYQASQDLHWLKWALALTERQIALFWNEEEKFFYDSVVDQRVSVRMKSSYDGAEPAPNSLAVSNLIQLGRIRNNTQWLQMAKDTIESFGSVINRYPPALPLMLSSWQRLNAKSVQVIIAGIHGDKDVMSMRQTAEKYLPPGSLLLLADGSDNQHFLSKELPYMETISRVGEKATAYVCIDFTCSLPVTTTAALQQTLEDKLSINEP